MLAQHWRAQGDVEAVHKLVTSHLRLVVKIAVGYRSYRLPLNGGPKDFSGLFTWFATAEHSCHARRGLLVRFVPLDIPHLEEGDKS